MNDDPNEEHDMTPAPDGTYDLRTHRTGTGKVYDGLPFNTNGCAVFAFARALADDPADEDEVAALAPLVLDDMVDHGGPSQGFRFRPETGTHYGRGEDTATALGFAHAERRECRKDDPGFDYGRSTRHDRYPTVAQVLRDNPDVRSAIVRTTGHMGYVRDGVGFALAARQRCDYIVVLETYDEPVAREKQADVPAMERARDRRRFRAKIRERVRNEPVRIIPW